jgi:predicted PurR-regulated permease PerM
VASVLIVGLLLGGGDGIGFSGYVLALIIAAVLVTIVQRFLGRGRCVAVIGAVGRRET